jgi:hypothetical protein
MPRLTEIITIDCIGSCKSNYHTTTTVPVVLLHIAHDITMMLKVRSNNYLSSQLINI